MLVPVISLSDDLDRQGTAHRYSEFTISSRDYQSNISHLEISSGPYSENLTAPLVSLGILANENRQYADAEDSFNRALRIHRINNGLQDLSQLPILDLIISNNISRQNWKAANDNYHFYYWIHRRNYGETDPRMLAVIDKLIAWHLLGTKLETGPHPGEHFIRLLDLNERALHIVDNYPQQDVLELAKRLYKLALIHYYIAIAVQRGEAVGQYLTQKFSPIQNGESYETTSKKIAKKRFRKSRKLVSRMASLYEHSNSAVPGSDAIALVYLADWDILFNRKKNANREYQLAYNKLLESGFTRELVNSFFLQPALLPKSDFFPDLMLKHTSASSQAASSDPETMATEAVDTAMEFVGWSTALPGVKFPATGIGRIVLPATEHYALVSFDILKDGLTENIRISKDNPETSLPRRAAYEAIWSAQFRPRLLDGKAVAVSGMSTKFYLPSIDKVVTPSIGVSRQSDRH